MKVTKEIVNMLIQTSPAGGIVLAGQGDQIELIACSEANAWELGYSLEEVQKVFSEDIYRAVYEPDKEELKKELRDSYKGKTPFQHTFRVMTRDGRLVWVIYCAKWIGQMDGKDVLYVSIQNCTKEMQELLDKAVYDAEHDALTGIYNRHKAFAESEKMMQENPDKQFAIVHFDIQRFRRYNSFFGEAEGDRLLIYIADMLRELRCRHDCGVYGRIESDVFFMCFPMRDGIVEWSKDYIHKKLVAYRQDFQVAGASGIYLCKAGTELSVESMFNRAMEAGKTMLNKQLNRVSYYTEDMESRMQWELRIAADMTQALEEKQFVLYLQPKFNTITGKPDGAEALVRWKHPQLGLIMPGQFIPLFEKNGLITALDQYVWETACAQIHTWLQQGKQVQPVSVNMSRVSMYNPETIPYLEELIRKYQIPIELLNLELTESAYMEDPEEMQKSLKQLQKIGFKIMMDDFGSGYSSLNALVEINFNYLKLDRKFLESIESDKRSQMVLKYAVEMAKEIQIPVIMEGVETQWQSEFIKSIGCDYIQGFLYAKPMPVEDYEEKIL